MNFFSKDVQFSFVAAFVDRHLPCGQEKPKTKTIATFLKCDYNQIQKKKKKGYSHI